MLLPYAQGTSRVSADSKRPQRRPQCQSQRTQRRPQFQSQCRIQATSAPTPFQESTDVRVRRECNICSDIPRHFDVENQPRIGFHRIRLRTSGTWAIPRTCVQLKGTVYNGCNFLTSKRSVERETAQHDRNCTNSEQSTSGSN